MSAASRLASALVAALLVTAAPSVDADAGEPPPERRLPFSDDLPPPPPLPQPLDRRFHGKLLSFDGDRVGFRWDWAADAELEDFEPFVPVRVTVRGGFERKDGALEATGTAGLRLRLGMLSDLKVGVDATLHEPHDLGVVLSAPGNSDESILCLVQDRFFTRFDAAAGNANMINKMGGVKDEDRTAKVGGMTEFRYVDRKPLPRLGRGHVVRFDVARKGIETTWVLTPRGESPTTFKGKDPDLPMSKFQAGVYVAGASARFGPMTIEGKVDPAWCQENGVLPFVAGDLLHPGNRFKGADRRNAELVETFVKQSAAATPPDPKVAVAPSAIAPLVGDAKVPLVIRMRAAEALADAGDAAGVETNVAQLLDAKELETRVLAWRVLRPRLPWHFRYEPDGDPAARREAALLVADYLGRGRDEAAAGKVFVDGEWFTPSRADQVRADWNRSWDLRTKHVRLRTNLTKEWADWTLAALEQGYRHMVRVAGREPPPERLPLSVLVFAEKDQFRAFCETNAYEAKAAWGRFADLDRLAAFDTFDKATMPSWPLHLLAKLQIRATTGLSWPTWFEEGRAAWFAHGDYRTAKWDGTTLETALPAGGQSIAMLTTAVTQNRLWSLEEFLDRDPRSLGNDDRRLWYAYAWALHAFLMDAAPEGDRARFATWQATMEQLRKPANEVDAFGRRVLLAIFAKDYDAFGERFRGWLRAR